MKLFLSLIVLIFSQTSLAQEICQSVEKLSYIHRPEAACPQVVSVCAESGRGDLKVTDAQGKLISMAFGYQFKRSLSDVGEYIYSSYGETFSYSALIEHNTDGMYPATELPGFKKLELWIFESQMPDHKTQVCYYDLVQK